MRFFDINGDLYSSLSKKDLMKEIYQESWTRGNAKNILDFCNQYALRIYEQYGYALDFDDEVGFINEMIKYELIIVRKIN